MNGDLKDTVTHLETFMLALWEHWPSVALGGSLIVGWLFLAWSARPRKAPRRQTPVEVVDLPAEELPDGDPEWTGKPESEVEQRPTIDDYGGYLCATEAIAAEKQVAAEGQASIDDYFGGSEQSGRAFHEMCEANEKTVEAVRKARADSAEREAKARAAYDAAAARGEADMPHVAASHGSPSVYYVVPPASDDDPPTLVARPALFPVIGKTAESVQLSLDTVLLAGGDREQLIAAHARRDAILRNKILADAKMMLNAGEKTAADVPFRAVEAEEARPRTREELLDLLDLLGKREAKTDTKPAVEHATGPYSGGG